MKKTWIVIALGVFVGPLSASLWAQGEFALDYEEITDFSHPMLRMARSYYSPYPGKPPRLKGLPEDLSGKVSYFSVRLGGKEILFALDSAARPNLYADTDGDRDLSDEQAFVGVGSGPPASGLVEALAAAFSSRPQEVMFGPIPLKVGDGEGEATAHVRVQTMAAGSRTTYLVAFPAGIRSGRVQLGGESYRVAILDANLDGRYDGVFSPRDDGGYRDGDWFGIDLNDNGTFDGNFFQSVEVFPLPKMIRAKEGYYSMEPLPDGSAVRVERVEPQFGTLELGATDVQVRLWSDTGCYRLRDAKGRWQLPAGKYMATQVDVARTDENRARWKLEGNLFDTGKLKNFEIAPGQTLGLKIGPPLTVKTTVSGQAARSGDRVYISLSVVGQAGEQYAAGATKNGRRVPAPKFKIIDESGKELVSAAFEYG